MMGPSLRMKKKLEYPPGHLGYRGWYSAYGTRCPSALSDQSLSSPPEETLGSWLPIVFIEDTDQTTQICRLIQGSNL